LYVGNIPFDAREDDVQRVFRGAGLAITKVIVPLERGKSQNRGFAFVDMANGREAMAALDAQDRLSMNGRPLRLGEAHVQDEEQQATRERPAPRLSKRLYVANLPYTIDEAQLGQTFAARELQPIEIYLPRDRAKNRSRGYAFVAMTSVDEAARAIGALNGATLGGRKITVRPADPREDDDG